MDHDELKAQFREYRAWMTAHPQATLVSIPRSDGNIEQRFLDASEIFIAVVDRSGDTFYGRIKGLWLH